MVKGSLIKVCKRHGLIRDEEIYYNHTNHHKICRACENERKNKYYHKNKHRINRRYREHWLKIRNDPLIKKKQSISAKRYYEEHKKRLIQHRIKRRHVDRIELSATYIKSLLTKNNGLKAQDIPDSLVALKKESVKLKRILKEKKDQVMKEDDSKYIFPVDRRIAKILNNCKTITKKEEDELRLLWLNMIKKRKGG